MHTTIPSQGPGGCDARYSEHRCLWGREPDPIVGALLRRARLEGACVLDAGCGEGRHARPLAACGARVRAIDVSALALERAARGPAGAAIAWERGDVLSVDLWEASLDAVVACALLHWVNGKEAIGHSIDRMQAATRPGGWHAVTVFNDRVPYEPPRGERRLACLLAHDWYVDRYAGWEVVEVSDTDSTGGHPGHPEPHTHAVTRILARRPA